MILHTEEQLRLAHSADVLHIDATGGIVRNSIYTKNKVFLFSIVPASKTDDVECVSVSDYLSERLRVEDITYWLLTFLNGMRRVFGERMASKSRQIIVTDASWALIHASLLAFGHTTILAYLEVSFRYFTMRTDKRTCLLFLCSSHVIARVSKTITGFANGESKRLLLTSFGALLSATTLEEAANIWKQMVILFGSSFYTKDVTDTERLFMGNTSADPPSNSSLEELLDEESFSEASPFRDFFEGIFEETMSFSSSSTSTSENPHWNISALQLLLRQWLPLFPLWSAIALVGTGYHHLSNAKVESFFSYVKNI